MVYHATGSFLGTALANLLAQLPKDKTNVIVVPNGNGSTELSVMTDVQTNISKFLPIPRFSGYVTCLADTDFFTTDIEPINRACLFRVQIALSVAGIFKVAMKMGSQTSVYVFNGGNALVENAVYLFDFIVHQGDKINFQSSLAGVANIRIQEIAIGV